MLNAHSRECFLKEGFTLCNIGLVGFFFLATLLQYFYKIFYKLNKTVRIKNIIQ